MQQEVGIARVGFGLNGQIPDGLLFRVSEISNDAPTAFDLQDQFIRDLLSKLSDENRARLIGSNNRS